MPTDDRIDVLDDGFVRLDGAMADDLSVVNAARVSFGVRKEAMEPSDHGLVGFLMRERHGSPFEHNSFRFHVRCPIFVAREWFRHRVGCLVGDAEVSFADRRGDGETSAHMTMRHLYELWQGGRETEVRALTLRVLDEESGGFAEGAIEAVVRSGVRPVYDVVLADGKRLGMTADHRVLTADGWHTLREAVGLVDEGGPRARAALEVDLLVNGVAAPASGELQAHAVGVESVRYAGKQETFDLTVAGPWANFVANGIVVHNSFNELSGRYTQLTDRFYVPAVDDVRTQVGKPGAYTFDSLDEETAERTRAQMREAYQAAYATYQSLLDAGVAREVARSVLPVGIYTEFYWTVNARSMMNFLSLRNSDTAQREIRRYAEAVEELFAGQMPVTHAAFVARERVAP